MAVTRLITVAPDRPDRGLMREAARVLRAGGLVAFPTETVYGLGAHALDERAVARIFVAKGRPSTDPVIVHLADAAQLDSVALDVPQAARELASAFWPGALTLILRKHPTIPQEVTAGLATVGVRVPSHPVAHMLISEAGVPIAAPSANRFSRPSPTSAEHVRDDLDGVIDLIVDGGPTNIGVESTIVDLTVDPPIVRRPGGVGLRAITSIVPTAVVVHGRQSADRAQFAPGQLSRHYAPNARLTLHVGDVDAVVDRLAREIRAAVASGKRVGVLAPEEDLVALAPRLAAIGSTGRLVTVRCGTRRNREAAAYELFGGLRQLDAAHVDVIFASTPADGELDAAIIDRLTRAAEGRVVYLSQPDQSRR
jgi:L-threonylcarbamoyladenylate synthase